MWRILQSSPLLSPSLGKSLDWGGWGGKTHALIDHLIVGYSLAAAPPVMTVLVCQSAASSIWGINIHMSRGLGNVLASFFNININVQFRYKFHNQ